MALQPLDDRIVVRPSESEEKTASGLVIPDTAKEKPQQGEVLAVGPGRRADTTGELVPMDVKVGDIVVYSKYGGTEITQDGEDFALLGLLLGGVGDHEPRGGLLFALAGTDDDPVIKWLQGHLTSLRWCRGRDVAPALALTPCEC